MGGPAASLGRLLDRTTGAFADLSGLLLALVVVLVNVEVVLRYVVGSSTLVADEYSGYFFVWMSLLGFGHALETGQFLRVEAVVDRVHGRPRDALELFGALAGIAVAAITTYACWLTFRGSWTFGTRSIQPSATPLWIPQVVMPVAFAWLTLLYVRVAAVRVRRLRGAGEDTAR
jgi:TRAP-type C4-dicarboxylate transport system permease small subunit